MVPPLTHFSYPYTLGICCRPGAHESAGLELDGRSV